MSQTKPINLDNNFTPILAEKCFNLLGSIHNEQMNTMTNDYNANIKSGIITGEQ